MSRLVSATLLLQRALQALRARHIRARFDDEERLVLRSDLEQLRQDRGAVGVLGQWPAIIHDGLADAVTTYQVSERDTATRRMADLLVAALVAVPVIILVLPLAAAVRLTSGKPAFVRSSTAASRAPKFA